MAATVREIIVPSDGELDRYARILAESFDYRFFGSALNKNRDLQEPMLRAHMSAALVKGEGEVHVAELPEVGAVGIAVWFGPGHVYLDSDTQRNAGHNQVVAKLPEELQKWWTHFLDEYTELTDRVLGPGVKLGGYHLQLIGVSPAHQGSVAIYKAMGYSVAGTGPMTVTPPHTGTFEMLVFIKHTELN